MSKVNIANYFVYDLANKFNYLERGIPCEEITDLVADAWNKKHFVSGNSNIKYNHNSKFDVRFPI